MITFRDILWQKGKLDWTLETGIGWTRLDVLILLVFRPLKTFLTSPEKVVRKIEIIPSPKFRVHPFIFQLGVV